MAGRTRKYGKKSKRIGYKRTRGHKHMGGYKRTRKGQTKRMVKRRGKRTRKLKGGNDGDDFWMNTKKEELKRDIDKTKKHLNYLERKKAHANLFNDNIFLKNDADRKFFINELKEIIKNSRFYKVEDIKDAKELLGKFIKNKGLYGSSGELLPEGQMLINEYDNLIFNIDMDVEDSGSVNEVIPHYGDSDPYDVFESPESPYARTTPTSGEYVVLTDTSSGDYEPARNYGNGKNMYMTAVNDDD